MARLPSPPLPLLLPLLLLLLLSVPLLSAYGLDSSPSLPRFGELVTLAERESPFPLVNAMGKREERAIPFSSSSPSPPSSSSEGRKRSQVHQGNSLTFYEHNFEGVFQNYGWNADSPNKILIISGDTPFLSVDTGKTFSNISGRLEGFDVLHQGSYGIRATVRSPADHDYFLFLGKGSNMWQTKDGGETFRVINAQAQGQPLYLRSFQLHPSRRDLLVASQIGSSCPQTPNCPYELYISKDFGETWTLITTHIWSYFWGSYESVTGVRKDSVYALVSSNKSGRQSASDDAEVIEVVVDDNNRVVTVSEHVQQMLAIGEYVYIISNKMELLVSHLGNPFRAVTFYGGELRGFTFMDVSEGSVVLIDTPSSSTGYASSRGDVWISDSTGTHFTRSLTRVVLQAGLGRFDFHKIESLEGTYIATIVDSRGSLWSKISWNRGGSWSDIKSKEVIDGVIDGERSPFVIYGEVHSSTTGTNFGFFSEESAPGLVLAIGHHGVQFVDYVTGEVTKGDVYLSRNGGKTFEKILEGLHYCSLLDEGSAVVCVPGHGKGTSAFLYSLDQGKTWKTEAFIDRPIDIAHLTADPDNFGLAALIFFIENQRVSLVSVDLTELNLPVCQETAYERWMPSDSQNERHCIMGHRSTYVRLKSDAACTSTLNSFLVEQENCPCGLGDFECDVGYFFNATSSSCSPEVGVPVQQIDCQDGHYMKDLNYRLIPGNTCNRTVAEAVNLEEDVKTECPVEHLIADNEFKKKLAIGLGLGMTFLAIVITAALGFVYWSKKKGYLQYRRVRTQEGGAVELEGPDHPEDFDEDNQPIEGSNVPNP